MATHSSVLAWRIPGTGSLVDCRLCGRTESDTTQVTYQHICRCECRNELLTGLPSPWTLFSSSAFVRGPSESYRRTSHSSVFWCFKAHVTSRATARHRHTQSLRKCLKRLGFEEPHYWNAGGLIAKGRSRGVLETQ